MADPYSNLSDDMKRACEEAVQNQFKDEPYVSEESLLAEAYTSAVMADELEKKGKSEEAKAFREREQVYKDKAKEHKKKK